MTTPVLAYSDDQAQAHDRIAEALRDVGVDIDNGTLTPLAEGKGRVMAVVGKAGSGKTLLLAEIVRALRAAGVDIVSGDWEGRRRKDRRTVAVLAPTNKAASVLRTRGVPATTIHRILYTPVYDPQYEKVAEWLAGQGERPVVEGLTEALLDRAKLVYDATTSVPAALASAGVRGSDFITGWKRREDPLDIGLIDESSMLDDRQFDDLTEIFPTLILFGDPAQLAPVNQSGQMIFDKITGRNRLDLSRIHRQDADNPILDLAHALGDPDLSFERFERMIEEPAPRAPHRIRRRPTATHAAAPFWSGATQPASADHRLFAAPMAPRGRADPRRAADFCDGTSWPPEAPQSAASDLEAGGLIKKGRAGDYSAHRLPAPASRVCM